MNVAYGSTSEYKYELTREELKMIQEKINRSNGQLQFLFQLVDGDIDRLIELEVKMKNNFISYCPDTVESIKKIMNLVDRSNYFSF